MSKFVEYFKGKFDSAISEKIKPENRPYIAYSAVDGLTYSEAVEEKTINYFYIESLEDNNVITLDSTTWAGYGDNKSKLEYSNNTTSWASMNGVDSITINNGERLYMRCVEGNICKDISSIPEEEADILVYAPLFKTSTNCNIGGNINTVMFDYTYKIEDCILSIFAFDCLFAGLDGITSESTNYIIDASKLELPTTELAVSCYEGMFFGCTSLTTAPEILPATELAPYCYQHMFSGCTSLTVAPELPATKLAYSCYTSMFSGCTSLTTAPEILPATTLANNCYEDMFINCTSLTIAPELPATTLAKSCCISMFSGCTSLTTAPEILPATTLANNCYRGMFAGCTSLTTAPELPATTLADWCYEGMFQGCTSLTAAPEILPATTLANNCYNSMFSGCTSLTTAPELPATTLAEKCYHSMFNGCTSLTTAPEILPATTLAEGCYNSMFSGCTSLTTAPELPATKLAYGCYVSMFSGCTSLTAAPELPATKLANNCYQSMFNSCTKLDYIKCLATDISAVYYYTNSWVDGVSNTGTFVKNPAAVNWSTGINGIPSGWTVIDAEL